MRGQGLDAAVLKHASQSLVVGICGGMQMLSRTIVDPDAIEHSGEAEALGLLPFLTRMNREKTTRQIFGTLGTTLLFGQPVQPISVSGYEIHVGETTYLQGAHSFSVLSHGECDGCISADTRIFGTYLHGIFDDDAFRHAFVVAGRAFHHLNPPTTLDNWKQKREESLYRLANAVREFLDMPRIFSWVGLDGSSKAHKGSVERSR
jgi:adenosylcobyric acid synthase